MQLSFSSEIWHQVVLKENYLGSTFLPLLKLSLTCTPVFPCKALSSFVYGSTVAFPACLFPSHFAACVYPQTFYLFSFSVLQLFLIDSSTFLMLAFPVSHPASNGSAMTKAKLALGPRSKFVDRQPDVSQVPVLQKSVHINLN